MTDNGSAEKAVTQDPPRSRWRSFFGRDSAEDETKAKEFQGDEGRPTKWSMGVLNDRSTHEVPGMYKDFLAKMRPVELVLTLDNRICFASDGTPQ